ncbi:MAG: hypothetical protein HY904_14530 [Deltaproteobacteria bacterium]|nr:hypothetical protein [Deltaproteobacteria bacterium]
MAAVRVDAPRVCLSASATATAALWLRSSLPAPAGTVGENLHIHPAVVVAGDFAEPVNAWQGIPQSAECTEWLDFERTDGHSAWIVPAFAHPVGTATLVPGHAMAHAALMERYPHLGVLAAMVHDDTTGTVRPDGDLGLAIDYWPNARDRGELALGLWASARLLFAAGARRVVVPAHPAVELHNEAAAERLRGLPLERGMMDVVAVHPMSTVPMGDDPRTAAVRSDGRHHGLRGLWVAHGSLFPTSIGGPPQWSVYALGLHVAEALVAMG